MTTTLIYEPVAHISDDYFQPLKISGAAQHTVKSVAKHDDSVNVRPFRAGDTVRCQYNDETCVIIWTREDWLWLDPVEYTDATPFTGRAHDYLLVTRGHS
jgi:hypothetical protein